jgi:hypothetical protein
MRGTDLLSSTIVDESGRPVGHVHDVRIIRAGAADGAPDRFRIAGLAVGGGRLAHAWGFAERRAAGPWLLRTITAPGSRTARFVPAARVIHWGPGTIRIRGRGDDLPYLHEQVPR